MDDEALSAWCDAMAAVLDLPIEEGERAEIIANLRVIGRQMKLVDDVALEDRAEPAAVYRA